MSVPCNGCRRCCINDAVRILDHEDASQWQTEPHPNDPRRRMLAHKPNRECVYLGPDGCEIHDQPRPQQCVTMDCRNVANGISLKQARRGGPESVEVWRMGRKLLRATA